MNFSSAKISGQIDQRRDRACRFSETWRGDGKTTLVFATNDTDCTDFLYFACQSVAGFLFRLHEILRTGLQFIRHACVPGFYQKATDPRLGKSGWHKHLWIKVFFQQDFAVDPTM